MQAGQQAVQRSANEEAVGHLTKGLEVLMTLPETPERMQQELMLHVTRGAPLVATRGFADSEVEQAFTRLREICRQMGDPTHLFPILFRLRSFYMVRGELDTSRELGEQLLQLAEAADDAGLLIEARYALGATLFYQGEFVPAQEHFERAAALYDREQHSSHAFLYGQDPGVASIINEALTLWFCGYPDRAVQKSQEAITLAQDVAHPFSLSFARAFGALFYSSRGEVQACQEQADAAISLSTEQGFPFWGAMGTVLRGWTLTEQGQEEEGISLLRRGMAAYQATGSELGLPHFLLLLIEAHAKPDRLRTGLPPWLKPSVRCKKLENIRPTLSCIDSRGNSPCNQGITKRPKNVFVKLSRLPKCKLPSPLNCVRRRASLGCGQGQGKVIEARDLLAPVYNWFTEGF